MNDQKKTNVATPGIGISEAERMAKITELLVGPALADESARVDKSVDRLNELAREQQEAISALRSSLRDLEEKQRTGMNQLQMRMLGMVEALLAGEDDLRARLMQHEILSSKLKSDKENGSA